jgi:hypothetical protein
MSSNYLELVVDCFLIMDVCTVIPISTTITLLGSYAMWGFGGDKV